MGDADDLADFLDKPYKYWMYLVMNECLEDLPQVQYLIKLVHGFGTALGDLAKVVVPRQGSYRINRQRVLARPWDAATRERLESSTDPLLLIIPMKLSEFKPQENPFMILVFRHSLSYAERYIELLSKLEKEISAGTDILQGHSLTKRKEDRKAILRRLYNALEVKIGVFGISIDVLKFLHNRKDH